MIEETRVCFNDETRVIMVIESNNSHDGATLISIFSTSYNDVSSNSGLFSGLSRIPSPDAPSEISYRHYFSDRSHPFS